MGQAISYLLYVIITFLMIILARSSLKIPSWSKVLCRTCQDDVVQSQLLQYLEMGMQMASKWAI